MSISNEAGLKIKIMERYLLVDYFCKCLECDTVLFDLNPQIGIQPRNIQDFPNAVDMIKLSSGLPVCPNCKTDENIIDL